MLKKFLTFTHVWKMVFQNLIVHFRQDHLASEPWTYLQQLISMTTLIAPPKNRFLKQFKILLDLKRNFFTFIPRAQRVCQRLPSSSIHGNFFSLTLYVQYSIDKAGAGQGLNIDMQINSLYLFTQFVCLRLETSLWTKTFRFDLKTIFVSNLSYWEVFLLYTLQDLKQISLNV